ncbi:hypothetical protein [Pseudonocardia sp. TRM90224]|uniref:hypothetical protein n=1 Tax=Pseudonocardia sp. TRM90224 TaxID=2812678 RepID=UPI001E333441|nr:hypothetical protein [Pseudonocardia sp. TRM90224]
MGTYAAVIGASVEDVRAAVRGAGLGGWLLESPDGPDGPGVVTVLPDVPRRVSVDALAGQLAEVVMALDVPAWLLVGDDEEVAELGVVDPSGRQGAIGWSVHWFPPSDPVEYLAARKAWDADAEWIAQVGGRPEAALALASVRNDPMPADLQAAVDAALAADGAAETQQEIEIALYREPVNAVLARACRAVGISTSGIGHSALERGAGGAERVEPGRGDRPRGRTSPGVLAEVRPGDLRPGDLRPGDSAIGRDTAVVLLPHPAGEVREIAVLTKVAGWVLPVGEGWSALVPEFDPKRRPDELVAALTTATRKSAIALWWGPWRAGFLATRSGRRRGGHEWRSSSSGAAPWSPFEAEAEVAVEKLATAFPSAAENAVDLVELLTTTAEPRAALDRLAALLDLPRLPGQLGSAPAAVHAWAAGADGSVRLNPMSFTGRIAEAVALDDALDYERARAAGGNGLVVWYLRVRAERPVWFRVLCGLAGAVMVGYAALVLTGVDHSIGILPAVMVLFGGVGALSYTQRRDVGPPA